MTDDRIARLAAVAEQVRGCPKCPLATTRTKAVPGAGDPFAEILFIGEGPGYHEDKQGLPFVGRSGDYLEKLLGLIGLKREQVFITNVVKCRPPENRDPMPNEIIACKPYLDEQETQIDPLIIVTLGRFSMNRYFPGGKITQIHGQPKYDDRRAYYPLFHPAAVLRNPALEGPMADDFRRIPQVIEEVKRRRAAHPPPSTTPASAHPPTATPHEATPDKSEGPDRPTQLTMF